MDPYSRTKKDYREPPKGFLATLRELGPGMILVGSIVGSGELIMTTKLGAVAGFTLLWFVLLSCFIKVVVQAELARHTISSGNTFLQVFNTLPGPSFHRPPWMNLTWLAVVLASCVTGLAVYAQLDAERKTLGAGVGVIASVVALAIVTALAIRARTKQGRAGPSAANGENNLPRINWFLCLWLATMLILFVNAGGILGGAGQALQMAFPNAFGEHGSRAWAIVIAVVVAGLLLSGTYASLEKMLIILVATFTLLTVICTMLLQWTDFAISWSDVREGLSIGLPATMTTAVILTAMAMYGATGVSSGEMWSYTYWCVEKGYARNVGEIEDGEAWPRRAHGWIRVMYSDVFMTMVIYTVGTVCFYFLGAAVLYALKLDPDGPETLSMLSNMYTKSLGGWAATLFVVGGFFVLFTTVLANVGAFSRLLADAMGIMGLIDSKDYPARLRFIRIFIILCLVMFSIAYWLFENPPAMIAICTSLTAAVMYPILGLGVIYLRYFGVDPRITPGKWTTTWLWICGLTLTVISPCGILLVLAIKFGWITISLGG